MFKGGLCAFSFGTLLQVHIQEQNDKPESWDDI